MPYIYAEWISRHTKNLNRIRYDLLIGNPAEHLIRRSIYEAEGVKIDDPAINLEMGNTGQKRKIHYGVYAGVYTPVQTIIDVVKEYITRYYTPEPNTLQVNIDLEPRK